MTELANENTSQDFSLKSLQQPLNESRVWVRICSVMGFISTAFLVLVSIGMMMFGGNIPQAETGLPSGMMTVMGVFYLFFALLYFFPSYFLHKYANAISLSEQNINIENLNLALVQQKSFWKFVGIFMLVMIILFVLGIVAAIAIPTMMGV